MNTFFYEDVQETIFNKKKGERVFMIRLEDVLTNVEDLNIVLETITSRQTYLSVKRPEKEMLRSPQFGKFSLL